MNEKEQPVDKNTKTYRAVVTKRPGNGQQGYSYDYRIWVSDSDYPNYRVYSVIGPEGFEMRDQNLIRRGDDESALLEERVRAWHPDHDTLTFSEQE